METEATLSAIRAGEVDAVIVAGPAGDRVFTLDGADHAYRIFLEDMGEGAATLTREGVLLYVNRRFAEIVGVPIEQVIGSAIFRFLTPSGVEAVRDVLSSAMAAPARIEVSFETTGEKRSCDPIPHPVAGKRPAGPLHGRNGPHRTGARPQQAAGSPQGDRRE